MDERKLIRLGNSSFAIALPKNWIVKSGLKKGDKVYLVRNPSGEIIVSPEFKKSTFDKNATIDVSGKNEGEIRREFTSAYINGVTIFEFKGDITKEISRDIKKITQEYISCEVTVEEENKIIAKDFFNLGEMNIKNFVRRIGNNIEEMFEIVIEGLKKDKMSKTGIEEVERIDLDINKFYFLNSRMMMLGLNNPMLISQLKVEPSQLFNNWWLAFHLEHTGDNLKFIAKKIYSSDLTDKKMLLELLTQLKEKDDKALKAFFDDEKEEAYKIMKNGKKLWESCEKLTRNKDSILSVLGEKLKNIENASYQILKITSQLNRK